MYFVWAIDEAPRRTIIISGNRITSEGLVGADALDLADSAGGYQLVSRELTHDGRGLIAVLLLSESVSIHRDLGLDFPSVSRLLLELLAQLEGDAGALEGGRAIQGVGVVILRQLDRWADAVAHFAHHQTDTCWSTNSSSR